MSDAVTGAVHTAVPEIAPGHWDTAEAREVAVEYADKPKTWLIMSDVSDFALANAQFLVSRDSLELIHYQTAAKERIRRLSVRLAVAEASLANTRPNAVSAAEGDLLGKCLEAIRTVVATRSDHFTARNGRRCSIEGDDGEKCWIIPFDVMTDLEAILSQAQARKVRS